MRLCVAPNRRFLAFDDGRPFFWLGDTAWELFHRLDRADADHYLTTRAAQGFTVIQAVALAEHGFDRPNAYGHQPLLDRDPAQPCEAYFEHVDWIVDRAAELGLWTGLLPTWGDKWNQMWGAGPELFTPDNAARYGEWLGRRYADRPVIWILGGDRPVNTWDHVAITRAMAAGIRHGDGGRGLMTFHPCGCRTSSEWFHLEPWLDLNLYQTGHSRDRACWRMIAGDYDRTPPKPCLDAEPGYEDHPNDFKQDNGYLDEHDVRKFLWWDLCAGACGHTYGCHDIWQFLAPGWEPITWARTPWREALLLPGASQMQHARTLLESLSFFNRIPDPALIGAGQTDGAAHLGGTRADDGSWGLVYFAEGTPATIHLDRLAGPLRAAWYDPRTGGSTPLGEFAAEPQPFAPPTAGRGQDWLLTLDQVTT